MNEKNLDVLTNVIGAVETGGQVYGQRRYNVYTKPYTNSSLEHTITLGWAGFYGNEARKLVQMILDFDPRGFHKIDSNDSIWSMLSKDWVDIKWNPSSAQKEVLIKLIDSEAGHKMQDKLFQEEMKQYLADCENDYPTADTKAQMMYCEIRHLGGKSGANRIFKRCNGDYSLDNIMASLVADQKDTSSSNQVGDKIFWSRHVKCRQFIDQYAEEEEKGMTPKERAVILLRQQSLKVMTGYTPEGARCFKNAGAWSTVPKKGSIVYFWGKPSGESNKRICHVGIVEKVDTSAKTFGTIEGNTSSSTWTTNGGCVARHSYSYASVGGQNRVNGFGTPDWEGAGVTADQFVAKAQSYLGYEEKKSNSQLDDFHANKGSNNYQKFERDVIGYTGDQWCQYFVDAIALYTCGGDTGKSGTSGGTATGGSGYMFTVSNVRNGSKGASVNLLQRLLAQAGIKGADGLALTIDGDCGKNTVYAIKQYQSKMGLEVDGDAGPKTWGKILGL